MATRSGVPFVTAATSVVIERLLDILIIVLLIAFSLTQLPNASSSVGTTTAAIFGATAIFGFIVLILFARYPAFAHRIAVTLETRIPLFARLKLRQRLDEILLGLRPLTHAGRAAHALIWTGIAWACSLATFYALERALNITGVNLWLGASLSVPLVAFSIALPVSIAGLGPFQVAVNVGGAAVGMAAL